MSAIKRNRRVAAGVNRSRIRPRPIHSPAEGSDTGSKKVAVVHTTAQTVTAIVTAATAIGALIFTGLSLNASRQQNEVIAQGQYTDRFTKAVEQLDRAGPDHLQARLGAIYALERLAHDSPRDQPTIIEVLSAFVRTTSAQPPLEEPSEEPEVPDVEYVEVDTPQVFCPEQDITADVQAALTVLGRRNTAHDNNARIDLSLTCLYGARLDNANFRGADLSSTQLWRSELNGADLSETLMLDTALVGSSLKKANLNRAVMLRADLRDTNLNYANLRDADVGATLINADLLGTDLRDADLQGADLRRADLSEAEHNAGTDVRGALIDSETFGHWW